MKMARSSTRWIDAITLPLASIKYPGALVPPIQVPVTTVGMRVFVTQLFLQFPVYKSMPMTKHDEISGLVV